MAERKHRKRRQRGRFSGLYKLLSFLLIFTALLVGSVAFFRVNKITVTGNRRYTEEEVVAAAGVELGENLLLVNRGQSALAITDNLPYVEKVVVVKRLPDTVELRLTESIALAEVKVEGSWWLLNRECKLLEQRSKRADGSLPIVFGLSPVSPTVAGRLEVGEEESEQWKLDGLKSLFAALEARDMLGNLSEFIDLSDGSAIYFGCGIGLTVRIPVSGDFDRRILSLQRVLETFQARGEQVKGTLDLTYGDQTARLLPNAWRPENYAEQIKVPPPENKEEGEPSSPAPSEGPESYTNASEEPESSESSSPRPDQ